MNGNAKRTPPRPPRRRRHGRPCLPGARRGRGAGGAGVARELHRLAAGMEARLVAERGIPFHPLAGPAAGRARPVARRRSLATLAGSAAGGPRLIRQIGADVVLGTGGYVSAPGGARRPAGPAAGRCCWSPNAHAGVANRWLSRWATRRRRGLPRDDRRPEVPLLGDRRAGARRLLPGSADPPARGAAPAGARRQPGREADQRGDAGGGGPARSPASPAIRIVHQAGRAQPGGDAAGVRGGGAPGAPESRSSPSSTTWPGRWRRAICWSRAPAPSPWPRSAPPAAPRCSCRWRSPRAHQVDNARLIAEAGAAEMIPSDQLSADRPRRPAGGAAGRWRPPRRHGPGRAGPGPPARRRRHRRPGRGAGRGALMFNQFTDLSRIHFVGIGGAGMSGIAEILLEYDLEVSGCDQSLGEATRRLTDAGRPDRAGALARPPGGGRAAGDLLRGGRRQPGGARGAAARHHRGAAGRDAGRADAPEVRHRRRRHPRQDHHHLAGRHPADRGRARSRRSSSAAGCASSAPARAWARATTWWPRPTSSTAASCA